MNLLAAIPYDLFTFGPWEIWGPLKIHSFGLLVAIGLLITFHMTSKRAEEKMGISGEAFQNWGIWLVVFGWCFSHVFNVVMYEPEKLAEDPAILFKVWGSISSYGGLLGGIIAAFLYKLVHEEQDLGAWVDGLGVYGLTFSWMFGRFGCASVHDHPGAETDFFLGVEWTDGVIRHDLGLYEAIWWIFIVAAVLIADRSPKPRGFFVALVALMYAPARFFFDFLRTTPEMGGDARYFGLTPAQYMSIIFFFIGLYFANLVRQREPVEWVKYDPPEGSASNDDDEEDDDDEEFDSADAYENPDQKPKKKHKARKKRKK